MIDYYTALFVEKKSTSPLLYFWDNVRILAPITHAFTINAIY